MFNSRDFHLNATDFTHVQTMFHSISQVLKETYKLSLTRKILTLVVKQTSDWTQLNPMDLQLQEAYSLL